MKQHIMLNFIALNDQNGNTKYFFLQASSIVRPECPELSHLHLIRADMISSGYVFRKSDDPEFLDVSQVFL